MRAIALMGLFAVTVLASDIARQYPPATAPGLIAGTTASYAAGAGVPEQAGKEKATHSNRDLAHNYGDLAK